MFRTKSQWWSLALAAVMAGGLITENSQAHWWGTHLIPGTGLPRRLGTTAFNFNVLSQQLSVNTPQRLAQFSPFLLTQFTGLSPSVLVTLQQTGQLPAALTALQQHQTNPFALTQRTVNFQLSQLTPQQVTALTGFPPSVQNILQQSGVSLASMIALQQQAVPFNLQLAGQAYQRPLTTAAYSSGAGSTAQSSPYIMPIMTGGGGSGGGNSTTNSAMVASAVGSPSAGLPHPTAGKPVAPPDAGLIRIRVPEGADVAFNGQPVAGSGTTRDFVTPELASSQTYSAQVTVSWGSGEQRSTAQGTVQVGRGQTQTLDFTAETRKD